MRFEVAKNRYHNKPIRYVERGRALGNGTYLRKINDEKYEVWMLMSHYVRDTYKHDWVRKDKQLSLFTIEPYGKETLITITNTEKDNLTASYRIEKWTGLCTVIRDYEMRFSTQGWSNGPTTYKWPALKAGVQFIVNTMGHLRLKEDQTIETSARFIDREKAKPFQENFNKLMKFGLLLTSIDAITYKDLRNRQDDTYLDDTHAVIRGEIEPNLRSVGDVLWSALWYNEKVSENEDKAVVSQRPRFERALKSMKKRIFKDAGLYKSKEYKA
jgi:hypothetical protein